MPRKPKGIALSQSNPFPPKLNTVMQHCVALETVFSACKTTDAVIELAFSHTYLMEYI